MTPHRTQAKADKQAHVPVPADIFVAGDARKAILLAGLLADQPDLRGADLLPDEWQKALDTYATSERP